MPDPKQQKEAQEALNRLMSACETEKFDKAELQKALDDWWNATHPKKAEEK